MKLLEFFIEIAVKASDAIDGLTKVESSSDKAKAALNATGREADALSRSLTRSGVTMVRSSRLLDAIGERAMNAGDRLANAGGQMTAFATLPIVAGLVKAHNEAAQAKDAISSVEGTIKSMGRTSEFTAAQLAKMTDAQSKNTLYDNDDVMRDVTQNLLTFSKVNKDIFAQAQEAVLDYAAASKTDLRAASTQVAKALQDSSGALALSKTGAITKTDAKELKAIAEKNGHLAYQEALLKALNKQYKGQAGIAAAADPAARSAKRINDAWEKVGGAVDRIIVKIEPAISRFVDWLETLDSGTLDWVVSIAIAVAAIGPLLGVIGTLVKGIGGLIRVFAFFKGRWGGFLIAIGRGKTAMMALLSFATRIGSRIGMVGQIFLWLGRIVMAHPIIAIIAAIAAAAYWLWNNWSWVGPKFWALWESIKTAAAQSWAHMKATFNAGVAWLQAIPGRMLAIGQGIMRGLVNGISSGAAWVRDKILSLASQVSDWFKSALGINSPSLVFAGFGANITEGLAQGLDKTARIASAASQRIADAVASPHSQYALSGMSVGVQRGAAMQSRLSGPVPTTAPRPFGGSGSTITQSSSVHAPITINGARDPKAVAREVGRELDRREQNNSFRSIK